MKQYCRYCAYLVTGNGTYCTAKERELADSAAKRTNKCKLFAFCEMDAYGETKGYKPRAIHEKQIRDDVLSENQLVIEMVGGEDGQ